jgi:putative ABC transport system permease protein
MGRIVQDLRYAIRTLLKKPGFCAIAVLTLALGIGANTAIFSVINAVVLKPLPFAQPERIAQIWEYDKRQAPAQGTISPHNFKDWRNQSKLFEQMAAYRYVNFTFTDGNQPESLRGSAVSSSLFAVLGVQPALGRDFLPEEDAPGKNHVVILSEGFWQRRFAGNRDVINQTIQLNGESYTVAGVMPKGFEFTEGVELWSPLGIDLARQERGNRFLFAIGRLKPETPLTAAQAEMESVADNLAQQYPNSNSNSGVHLIPLHQQVVNKSVKTSLFVLLGAVGLVLLIACANVTNLLLVRASARRKEIAIRLSIGASRWHLIRQFLTEGILLSMIGGGLGLLIAWWGVDLILAVVPNTLPRVKEIGVDSTVLIFTLATSLIAGTLSALVPAFYGTKVDLNHSLKESGQSVASSSLRQGMLGLLVSAEIAVALVVLIGAGLLLTSFLRLQQINPGFNPTNLLTVQLSLPNARYKDAKQQALFYQQALERINSIATLESAGAVSDLPFSNSRSMSSFEVEGRPRQPGDDGIAADHRVISSNYFKSLNIPFVEGRDFNDRDNQTATGVVVVNQSWARTFFPNDNPMGKRIQIGDDGEIALYGNPIWREVVGVVGDIKHGDLTAPAKPEMYVPYLQEPIARMMFVVRGKGDSGSLTAAVRNEIHALDSNLPIYNIRLMDERLARSILPQRFNAMLIGIFAVVALILAMMGIYGVMAYTVEQNTRDIGIRIALGAQQRDVMGMVIKQGLRLALIGIAVGLIAAYLLSRTISDLLYGISPTDAMTFVYVSLILTGVALVACFVPARRAMKVDPMVALRYE